MRGVKPVIVDVEVSSGSPRLGAFHDADPGTPTKGKRATLQKMRSFNPFKVLLLEPMQQVSLPGGDQEAESGCRAPEAAGLWLQPRTGGCPEGGPSPGVGAGAQRRQAADPRALQREWSRHFSDTAVVDWPPHLFENFIVVVRGACLHGVHWTAA